MSDLLKFVCTAPGCGKKLSTQNRLEVHIKLKHPKLFSLLCPDYKDLNLSKNPIENILNIQKTKSNILQPIKKRANIPVIENSLNKSIIKNIKTIDSLESNKINNSNSNSLTNSINLIINEITDDLIFNGENNIYEDYTEIINLDLSKKNIELFKNNKNIPFEHFSNLVKLNLSYNNIYVSNDLKYFTNIKILIINNNKIKDISFCEFLSNLEQFNIHSNEVTSIEPLIKCNKLKILDISNNKIDDIITTLKAFKKIKNLEELLISHNPFIINFFAYKHYFIYKFQNLLRIDGEVINEIDKDISGRFIRENISMYENIKELNDTDLNNSYDIDEINNDNSNIIYKIGNTVISKEMYIPYKSKNKNNSNNDKENKSNSDAKDNQEIKKENIKLKEIIKEQNKEIDNLKLELENSNLLIKDYESTLSQYNLKYGDINNFNNDINKSVINENNFHESKYMQEIQNLKNDLNIWKKENFELYEKMNKEDYIKTKINNIKIERPKTAVARYDNPLKEFKKLYNDLEYKNSKNIFADVLEEETDEDEEEEEQDEANEEEKEGKIKGKNDNNKLNDNSNKIINMKNEFDKKLLKPLAIKNKKDFNKKNNNE